MTTTTTQRRRASVTAGERTYRRVITFLLNEIQPARMTPARLEEFARCLDALPAGYQVLARTRRTAEVAALIRRNAIRNASGGIEGQLTLNNTGDRGGWGEVRRIAARAAAKKEVS